VIEVNNRGQIVKQLSRQWDFRHVSLFLESLGSVSISGCFLSAIKDLPCLAETEPTVDSVPSSVILRSPIRTGRRTRILQFRDEAVPFAGKESLEALVQYSVVVVVGHVEAWRCPSEKKARK